VRLAKMGEKEHTLTVTLDPEMWNRFVKIKEGLGMKWNASVLRYLISAEYHRATKSGRTPIPFNEQDLKKVEEWAEKLGVTPQQFVEEALTMYLKEHGIELKS